MSVVEFVIAKSAAERAAAADFPTRELWMNLGRPFLDLFTSGDGLDGRRNETARSFWRSVPPSSPFCDHLTWDESRGAPGPYCSELPGEDGFCDLHKPLPMKAPIPAPVYVDSWVAQSEVLIAYLRGFGPSQTATRTIHGLISGRSQMPLIQILMSSDEDLLSIPHFGRTCLELLRTGFGRPPRAELTVVYD